ncbi:MAG: type II methionyl aminopeptidase [Candidatus Hermodarchaeota archaeon]
MSTESEEKEEKSWNEKVIAYRKAGKIAYEALEKIKPMIKPQIRIIDICETVENYITEQGAKLAFPCNVSINNIAAHYTATRNDSTVIPEKSVVKVDCGAHIDGFIADTAFTITLDPQWAKLVEASEKAFEAGIEIIEDGLHPYVVGTAVEEVIKNQFGFRPLRELSGHQIDEYILHGEKMLPNISVPLKKRDLQIKAEEAYAFETFATTGTGSVHDDLNKFQIYSLQPFNARVRSPSAREIRKFIAKEQRGLPFSERWLAKKFPPAKVSLGLRALVLAGVFRQYYTLADVKDSFISQYEHTFLVHEDHIEITTRPPFKDLEESTPSESADTKKET